MRIQITIPPWEDTTIAEAALANLFVSEGTPVRQGQVIGELMVEKATVELAAPADGVVQQLKLRRGDVVKPGMLLADLVTEAEPVAASVAEPVAASEPTLGAAGGVSIPTSPAARRLARELGVDLARVVPADGQRITEDDVRRAAASTTTTAATPTAPLPSAAGATAGGERGVTAGGERGGERGETLIGRRKVIAERMLRSLQTTAQLTLTTDVRADALFAARERAREGREGLNLTYSDLLGWLTVLALKRHPAMNATLEGDRLRQHEAIHLGLAVAVEDGLLVPVVRDAGILNFTQFTERAHDLTARARNNTLPAADLSGSTFTLTTLGAYEIDAFTPILNPPEVGILGIGRIREAIVPRDGQPVVGRLMTLSLTFDHRAIDGAPAAAFLQTVKQLVESPTTFSEIQ